MTQKNKQPSKALHEETEDMSDISTLQLMDALITETNSEDAYDDTYDRGADGNMHRIPAGTVANTNLQGIASGPDSPIPDRLP